MKKWLILSISIIFIISCDKNISLCDATSQKRFVYNDMKENYLWNNQMPQVDIDDYSSAEELLEALKVTQDRWSFIANKKDIENYFNNGKYIGIGVKFTKSSGNLYVSLVFNNSPAYNAGLKRGAKILKINGVNVATASDKELNDALGADKVGTNVTIEALQDGSIQTFNMQKDEIFANSVIKKSIINSGNKKIGYLVFDKFVQFSGNELYNAFKYFRDENIDKLIVDLRYNGGGLLSIARYLASLIAGYQNGYFAKLIYNDNNQNYNQQLGFISPVNALNLSEVYFITTSHSCSASEAVINGLKPYINVKIFGHNSCGKPVGMIPKTFCDKELFAINFKIVNSEDFGDYFNGIDVDCQANDDLTHDFGDTNESMLKSVLYYINNNSCMQTQNNRLYRVTKRKSVLKLYGMHKLTNAF